MNMQARMVLKHSKETELNGSLTFMITKTQ
jgi:hypothetical protein